MDFSGLILELCTYECIQNFFVLLKSIQREQLNIPKTLLNCIFTKQAIRFNMVSSCKGDYYLVLLLSATKRFSSSVVLIFVSLFGKYSHPQNGAAKVHSSAQQVLYQKHD